MKSSAELKSMGQKASSSLPGSQQERILKSVDQSGGIPLLAGEESESLYVSSYRSIRQQVEMTNLSYKKHPNSAIKNATSMEERRVDSSYKNMNQFTKTEMKMSQQLPSKTSQFYKKKGISVFSSQKIQQKIEIQGQRARPSAQQTQSKVKQDQNKALQSQLLALMTKYGKESGKNSKNSQENPSLTEREYKELINDVWSCFEEEGLGQIEINDLIKYTNSQKKPRNDNQREGKKPFLLYLELFELIREQK